MTTFIDWGLAPEGTTHIITGNTSGSSFLLGNGCPMDPKYYEKHGTDGVWDWTGTSWRFFQTLEDMMADSVSGNGFNFIRISKIEYYKSLHAGHPLKEAIKLVQSCGFIVSLPI
jgi:hypothetical protein